MRPTRFAALFVAGSSLLACSDSGDDTTVVDAGSTVDASPDTRADATDSAATDTGAVIDAPPDGASDAPLDAAEVSVDAAGRVEATTTGTIGANCMPAVPADPATITGTLTVKNGTGATIGPVSLESAVLRAPGGAAYATWKIDKVDLGSIAAGATKSSPWKKTADTWSSEPADQICKKCGKEAVVELTVLGLGGTAGTTVASPTITVSCVF